MKYTEYSTDDFLMDDYFLSAMKGKDPEAKKFWDKWVSDHPEKKEEVDEAVSLLQVMDQDFELLKDKYTQDVESEWDFIRQQTIDVEDTYQATFTADKNKSGLPKYWGYIAAASVLLLVGMWFTFNQRNADEVITTPSIALVEKTVARGIEEVKLADGSIVTLKAGSTLKYPAVYTNNKRNVELVGEAYFDIAKDPKRPFTVFAGNVETVVHGTQFNVAAYATDEDVKVSLVEGSVSVKSDQVDVKLVPGKQFIYNRSTKAEQIVDFDPEKELLWMQKIIVFDKSSLNDVVTELERWYGVKVTLIGSQNKNDAQFTGKFDTSSLNNILDNICFSLNAKYEVNGKEVKIILQ
ncbi:FecR domain-containing protein [Limibacter armeniacum]|uniref:FecR family protein n=1 Tax=Limibacter armeniacum TaxID=466084 RepID=UPI002FE598BA